MRLEDHPTVRRSVPFLRDPIHKRITLWLLNIAMGNGSFIDDFPMDTSIYKGFSMAMLNNQMVLLLSPRQRPMSHRLISVSSVHICSISFSNTMDSTTQQQRTSGTLVNKHSTGVKKHLRRLVKKHG